MKTASKPIGIVLLLVGAFGIFTTFLVSFASAWDTVGSTLAAAFAATLFCFVPGALFLRWGKLQPNEPVLPADWAFYASLWILGGTYLLLIVAMLVADLSFTTPESLRDAVADLHWDGMQLVKINVIEQERLGLPANVGLGVAAIEPNGSADGAGVKLNDIIVKINGAAAPGTPSQFAALVEAQPHNQAFELVVVRGPKEHKEHTILGAALPASTEFRVRDEIKYSIKLSLISCSITALLSLWVGVPMGYLLARTQFWGKFLVDALLDIPIVLPPLVIGLSLLILFQTTVGQYIEDGLETMTGWIGRPTRVTYAVPSVILAQFTVAAAFAVRTMRVTFEQISPRPEQVAMTLGCTRSQAFWRVVLPEARRGVLTAGTLSWARSLGEFGPILIFSGATRLRTEVLPTTVFLELSVGKIEAAIAVSLLMIAAAVIVLVLTRTFGLRGTGMV